VSSSSSVGAIPDLIEIHISKPWCKDINDLVSDAKRNGEAFISRHPFWVTQIGRGKARLQAEDTDPAEEYVWHQCVNVGCSKFTTKVTMGEKCKWRCSKGHVNPKAKPTFFFSVSLRSNNVDEYLLDNVIVSDEQAQLFLQTTAEKFDKIEEESEEFENVLSRVKDVIFRCSIRAAVNDLNPRFVNFKIETVERN
jgi:hypothetical protein